MVEKGEVVEVVEWELCAENDNEFVRKVADEHRVVSGRTG